MSDLGWFDLDQRFAKNKLLFGFQAHSRFSTLFPNGIFE
jgi:hypothetical protein